MQTPYIALTVHPSEEVAVEALIHDRLAFWFATGRYTYANGKLSFEVRDVFNILAELETLNSAKVEDGAAFSLMRRIRGSIEVPT